MKISKSSIALGISTATILSANAAFAAPDISQYVSNDDATQEVTTIIEMAGDVVAECAVVAYDNEGTVLAYNSDITGSDVDPLTTLTNGISGDVNRTQKLSATTSVKFDCNTENVLVKSESVATVVQPDGSAFRPEFLPVTHTVSLFRGSNRALQDSEIGLTPTVDLGSLRTNQDGDIRIDLQSDFTADKEELPAGQYDSTHTITVTAN